MRKNFFVTLACVFTLCLAATPLAAEGDHAGYKADFLHDFDRTSEKLRDLAKAIPKDAFTWRLTDEVRSISEIYMHVAGANFYFARDLGVELPADLPEELEEVTTKAEVTLLFLESLDHVHQALEKNDELDKKIELFGRKRTIRSIFMILAGHAHEHLGQAIAYARAKGVVPPWSQSGN